MTLLILTFGQILKRKGLLYNLALKGYQLGIWLASFRNEKAKKWIEGRRDWKNQLKKAFSEQDNVIWFHCASLGEFEQGRPVIEEMKQRFNGWKILVTFFSPSGFEIRKNYKNADCITYLPLDTKKNAKKFIGIVDPKVAFFVKYEFWKNYLTILYKKKIPLYLISGVFRENHFFFKWYGKPFLKILNAFSHFFVQNQESSEILKINGFSNVTVTGDTRFDRVIATTQSPQRFPEIEKFIMGNPVIICGSTWEPEEMIIAEFIMKNKKGVKFIIAPHEVHDSRIERLQKQLPAKSILYSEISEKRLDSYDVLIINTIGVLSSLYQYGSIAFVGGAFNKGLHNILEAAAFGMPVLFGPNIKKFQEAIDLVKEGAAFKIGGYKDFENIVVQLLNSSQRLKQISAKSKKYVVRNLGAKEKIISKLKKDMQVQ